MSSALKPVFCVNALSANVMSARNVMSANLSAAQSSFEINGVW